ncbi:hypothetical protein P7C73_g2135, partial [Tremellales sp. Uapishka_1]
MSHHIFFAQVWISAGGPELPPVNLSTGDRDSIKKRRASGLGLVSAFSPSPLTGKLRPRSNKPASRYGSPGVVPPSFLLSPTSPVYQNPTQSIFSNPTGGQSLVGFLTDESPPNDSTQAGTYEGERQRRLERFEEQRSQLRRESLVAVDGLIHLSDTRSVARLKSPTSNYAESQSAPGHEKAYDEAKDQAKVPELNGWTLGTIEMSISGNGGNLTIQKGDSSTHFELDPPCWEMDEIQPIHKSVFRRQHVLRLPSSPNVPTSDLGEWGLLSPAITNYSPQKCSVTSQQDPSPRAFPFLGRRLRRAIPTGNSGTPPLGKDFAQTTGPLHSSTDSATSTRALTPTSHSTDHKALLYIAFSDERTRSEWTSLLRSFATSNRSPFRTERRLEIKILDLHEIDIPVRPPEGEDRLSDRDANSLSTASMSKKEVDSLSTEKVGNLKEGWAMRDRICLEL